MICPHCIEHDGVERMTWPYDDHHVTCKLGHRQRTANAVAAQSTHETLRRRRYVTPIAGIAIVAVLADVLSRLL